MPRSIDDVIQNYRGWASQSQAPLSPPGLYTTANPIPEIPYAPPNAFQTPPGGLSVFRPPTPPLLTPTMSGASSYETQVAGRFAQRMERMGTPEAATEYLRGRRGRQAGERVGGITGAIGGGYIGGIAGAATGYSLGAEYGGDFGQWLGESWVGGAIDWVTGESERRQRMGQMLAGGVQLQSATYGNVMMGQRDIGLGGQGINERSATRLASRLSSLTEATEGGLSQQGIMDLTRSAAQMGFLEQTVDTDQIFEVVKKLTKVVGAMAKITGDPDTRRNLQEIMQFQRMGFNLDQTVSAVESVERGARMAGLSRPQFMATAGTAGARMFRGAGLAGGPGVVQAAGAAALGRMGAAGLSPMELELAGGQAGLTGMFMQNNLRFLQGPGQLAMLQALQPGGPGQLQLGGGFGQQMQGPFNIGQMLQQGVGNIRTPGQLMQFMAQRPELLSEAAGQMGEFGMPLAMARTAQGLVESGMFRGMGDEQTQFMTALSVQPGMDPVKARRMMRTLGSEEFRTRARAQIQEEIKRRRYENRQAAIRRIDEREERREEARDRAERNRVLREAGMDWLLEEEEKPIYEKELEDALRAQQEEEDEAAGGGRERVYWTRISAPVEKERKEAERLAEAGWKVADIGTGGELGGMLGGGLHFDPETKRIRTGVGIAREFGINIPRGGLGEAQIQAFEHFIGRGATGTRGFLHQASITESFLGTDEGRAELARTRRTALEHVRRTGKSYEETQKVTEKEWHRALKQMHDVYGAGTTAQMRHAAVMYAKKRASARGEFTAEGMKDAMAKAMAESTPGLSLAGAREVIDDAPGLEKMGFRFIEESGDTEAQTAMMQTVEAYGMSLQGVNKEAIENFLETADEEVTDLAATFGFTAAGRAEDMQHEEVEAFEEFRNLGSEDQALLLGMISGPNEEVEKLRGTDAGRDRIKRLRQVQETIKSKLSKKQFRTLQAKARGMTEGGLGPLQEALQTGLKEGKGIFGGLRQAVGWGEARERIKELGGEDVAEITAEGKAAPVTPGEEDAELKRLEDQLKALDELSKVVPSLGDAASDLKKAAQAFEKVAEESGIKVNKPDRMTLFDVIMSAGS